MKIFTLKTLFMSALLCVGLSAWAADETITFSNKNYSNGEGMTNVSGTDFTISFHKGTNSNSPKYYDSGKAIRAYGGNNFIVSSDTKTIEKIEITFGTSDGSNEITTDVGIYSDGTWTGSATSVTFTIGGTSGNRRLASVAVTYATGGTDNPVITAANVDLEYNATSGEIEFSIANPVEGKALTATEECEWISGVTVSGGMVTFTTTENEGSEDRTATITLQYEGATDKEVTVTQKHFVRDYAILPFEWDGGASADFKKLEGVTTNGLGSDYAAANAPYLMKLDSDGDYIQIKTNGSITKVAVEVKMLGGSNTSTLTVQGSADGENFTDVEALTISGKQNDVLSLETSAVFAANYRYVRMVFTKGSNVGVGPISIINYVEKSISDAGYATFYSPYALDFSSVEGLTAYIVSDVSDETVTLTEVESVPANTPVVLKADEDTYSIPVIANADAVGTNYLKVSDGTKVGGDDVFALAKKDGEVGFYAVSNTVTIPAGKCYLDGTANAKSRLSLSFEGEDATGIQTVKSSKADGVYYNLRGQRVVNPVKGIYILNGKKILVNN
mgnify:CR=1 FL=1